MALSREQQIERSLVKIVVTVRTPAGKKKVAVDAGVAKRLARFETRTSQRVLAWAARQAMTLRVTREDDLAERFILEFDLVLDWAEASLELDAKQAKARSINLLQYDGVGAWERQAVYHRLLSQVDNGQIAIPEGWNGYQTAAALGISPGMLRQINRRGAGAARSGSIRVSRPGPLQHRDVLMGFRDGYAWIWIHPDDKDRVGRNIGLCISKSGWSHRLQFALVDEDNRPWAVLTMSAISVGPARVEPNQNQYVEVRDGKARVSVRALFRDRIVLTWGECKGRFNRRPIPDPQRKYATALITSGLLGPLQIRTGATIAAADIAALLLQGLGVDKARSLFRQAGGMNAVYSLADSMDPMVMGDGGPGEKTQTYFEGSPSAWIHSPLLPLYLAAQGKEQLKKIWTEHASDPSIRDELTRVLHRRKELRSVFTERDLAVVERKGGWMPPSAKHGMRQRRAQVDDWNAKLRESALHRWLRKTMATHKIVLSELPNDPTPLDLYYALLIRNHPMIHSEGFLYRLFYLEADQSSLLAVDLAVWTFTQVAKYDGDIKALNIERKKKEQSPLDLSITMRSAALAVEPIVKAATACGNRALTAAELADYIGDYGEDWTAEDPPNRLADYVIGPDQGWHCFNCIGISEDTGGILSSLYEEVVWAWGIHLGFPEDAAAGELAGGEGFDHSLETLWDYIHDVETLEEAVESEVGFQTAGLLVLDAFPKLKPGDLSLSRWASFYLDTLARVANVFTNHPNRDAVPLIERWAAMDKLQHFTSAILRAEAGLEPAQGYPDISAYLGHQIVPQGRWIQIVGEITKR